MKKSWKLETGPETGKGAYLLLCLPLMACMAAYAWTHPPEVVHISPTDTDRAILAVFFTLLYGLALCCMALREREGVMPFLFRAAVLAALLGARLAIMGFQSSDMTTCLLPWCDELKTMSVRMSLAAGVGNYNVPYQYFLIALVRLPLNPVYGIKAVSIFFDVVLAAAVAECVSLAGARGERARPWAFLLTLAAPTVFLNSAWWGQCDAIFTAFCVLSLWCALKGKGGWAVVCFTCAFAFKLQAVFFLPALIGCLIAGRIRARDFLWSPVVFLAWCIPPLLCGRPLGDVLSIYAGQTAEYHEITQDAPNLYQFLGDWVIHEPACFWPLDQMGLMLGGAAAVLIVYLFWRWREDLSCREIVQLCCLSAALLPFLLPRMHERYFFLADVLSLLIYFYDRKLWYVPILTISGSFLTYVPFLFLTGKGVTGKYGAALMLAGIILTARSLLRSRAEREELA